MNRCILSIILLLCVFSVRLSAEEKLIASYSDTERMIHLAVSGDYVWCGTWGGGVARYDRRNGSWKIFTSVDGLGFNTVQSIFIDREGRSWFTSSDFGISCFDGTEWVHSIKYSLASNTVYGICEDANGQMWCCTHEGVWYLKDGRWNFSLSGASDTIAAGSDGFVWCTNDYAIRRFDGTAWRTYAENETGIGLGSDVTVVGVDKNNVLWFQSGGARIASFDGKVWKKHTPSGSHTTGTGSVLIGPDGNLWIQDNDCIYKFNDQKKWEIVVNNDVLGRAFAEYGLKMNGLFDFWADSSGVLWFIDTNVNQEADQKHVTGLFKFENGKLSYSKPEGIAVSRPVAIAQDRQGDMWIGGSYATGISQFDGKTWTTYNGFTGVAYYDINSIVVDHNNTVWIATPNGVLRYDGTDWKLLTQLNSGLKYDQVSVIYEDLKGVLWFGTQGGVSSYDGSVWNYYNSANTGTDLSEIKSIVEDGNGTLWLISGQSLVGFDKKTWMKKTLFPQDYNFIIVSSLAVGQDGSLWGVATGRESEHFSEDHNFVFHLQNESWSKFMMPADPYNPNSIAIDRKSIIWVGGKDNNMVSCFDVKTWRGYGIADGLATKVVNSIFVDRNNVKWVGTQDGLFCIGEDSVSGVSDRNEPTGVLPALSIYPNPFNLSVSLGFTLPSPGKTELSVYSITGQKVKQVVSGFLPAGKQMVTWDGRDDSGREVSSGIYIARLKAGGQFSVRRMTLVK